MEISFECLEKFYEALQEVEVLIATAKAYETDKVKYLTYNKASLLLLAAKFENFVEQIVAEYIDVINSMKLNCEQIPECLRINHSLFKLEKSKSIFEQQHRQEDIIRVLSELGELWSEQNIFEKISVNCKFNYGRHGDKELIKLFANIGIKDIFAKVKIYNDQESLMSDDKIEVDFRGLFNSMSGMRNNIIHQDATPDLTHNEIEKYACNFKEFAKEVSVRLAEVLSEIYGGAIIQNSNEQGVCSVTL